MMQPSTLNLSTRKQHKYNKITQQKKFHLLNLLYKDRLHIREAAEIAGINYLTAKTILFFHKNNCKSYRFEIGKACEGRQGREITTASYSTIRKIAEINQKLIKPKSRIQVICSIGNVLSPPTMEQVTSPSTCSNCQDAIITKPPPLVLERNHEHPTLFIPQLIGQENVVVDFKQIIQSITSSTWKNSTELSMKMHNQTQIVAQANQEH